MTDTGVYAGTDVVTDRRLPGTDTRESVHTPTSGTSGGGASKVSGTSTTVGTRVVTVSSLYPSLGQKGREKSPHRCHPTPEPRRSGKFTVGSCQSDPSVSRHGDRSS